MSCPPGPGVAHPPHRLTQELGGAAGGVGPALAQPGHQHVAGSGGNGQQRVIATDAGVAVVAAALLGQSVGLADRRIKVDGEWCVAGAGTGLPGPGQQLAAHPVQLADMSPPEAAQEGAQGGGRLDHTAQGVCRLSRRCATHRHRRTSGETLKSTGTTAYMSMPCWACPGTPYRAARTGPTSARRSLKQIRSKSSQASADKGSNWLCVCTGGGRPRPVAGVNNHDGVPEVVWEVVELAGGVWDCCSDSVICRTRTFLGKARFQLYRVDRHDQTIP